MATDYSQEQTLKWMDNVRHSVKEILSKIDSDGEITLGEAENIARSNNVALHSVLPELESRCRVNYSEGIIKCQK